MPITVTGIPNLIFLQILICSNLVPQRRLELLRLATLVPKTSVSTIPPPGHISLYFYYIAITSQCQLLSTVFACLAQSILFQNLSWKKNTTLFTTINIPIILRPVHGSPLAIQPIKKFVTVTNNLQVITLAIDLGIFSNILIFSMYLTFS